MKALKTVQYRVVAAGFKAWLSTLSYAPSTIYQLPRQLLEFLHWLENKQIKQITQITPNHVKEYIQYFMNRPNQRRPGGVSISHINKQIDTLAKFSKYLKATQQVTLHIVKKLKETKCPNQIILSKSEIRQLYQATDHSLIGMRDRAMLGIYYGCGLRKSEGLALSTTDILFERKLLYIRKPKNGYERYVPINLKVLQALEIYLYTARPLLLTETITTESLFISERGTAMKPGAMVYRLKTLQQKTDNPILQNKSFGLHALRHSIATHLLQAGMTLENIALFLGHRSLDSTQLYTHLVNRNLGLPIPNQSFSEGSIEG